MKIFNKKGESSRAVYKLSKKEAKDMLERVQFYISSNLSLDKALISSSELLKKKSKNTVLEMVGTLRDGKTFSQALIMFTKLPETIIVLIHGGEISQNLQISLKNAQEILDREDEIKKKIISSSIYPIVIGLFALILTFGLVKGVLPQIIPMLLSLNVRLPLLTRVVIYVSTFIIKNGFLTLSILVFVSLVIIFAIKKMKVARFIYEKILLHTPIIGSITKKYYYSLFLSCLGSLLASNIDMIRSFRESIKAIRLNFIRIDFEDKISDLIKGQKIGYILSKIKSFPKYLIALIGAGEDSGKLADSIIRSQKVLETRLDHELKKLTSILEPLLMIFMGIIIGSIALSIMMPIYEMSKVLQR